MARGAAGTADAGYKASKASRNRPDTWRAGWERAVASPTYLKRYLPQGFTAHAVAEAPSLAWNRDDALQDTLVRRAFRRPAPRPQHFVPTAEGFGAAVRCGLGWGMFPDSLASPRLADGSFVRIADVHLDVPLFWQCWKLDSQMVNAVTDAVRSAAARLRHRG